MIKNYVTETGNLLKVKNKTYHEKYNSFYQSNEWQNLRNRKFLDADGMCELCYKNGIKKCGKEVHHIIPIEEDWNKRLDYDNLILLCSDCHNAQHERISQLQKFLKEWEQL